MAQAMKYARSVTARHPAISCPTPAWSAEAPALASEDQLQCVADRDDREPAARAEALEVVPFAAEAHYGLLGGFAVADVDETARVAYLDTVTEGYIVEGPSVVAEVMAVTASRWRGTCRAW
jgi:Domain of unknown function (DUF5753)